MPSANERSCRYKVPGEQYKNDTTLAAVPWKENRCKKMSNRGRN